jgi:hypothetical protein
VQVAVNAAGALYKGAAVVGRSCIPSSQTYNACV